MPSAPASSPGGWADTHPLKRKRLGLGVGGGSRSGHELAGRRNRGTEGMGRERVRVADKGH